MSTAQITGLTATQLVAIGTADFAAFNTDDLAALTAVQMRALSTAMLDALSPTQIAAFTGTQISALNSRPAGGVEPGRPRHRVGQPDFRPEHRRHRGHDHRPDRRAEHRPGGRRWAPTRSASSRPKTCRPCPHQLAALRTAQLAALTTAQLAALGTAELASLSQHADRRPDDAQIVSLGSDRLNACWARTSSPA
jgi:hypothetical protein